MFTIALVGIAGCGGDDSAEDSSSTSEAESAATSESVEEQIDTTAAPEPSTTKPAASTVPAPSTSVPTPVVEGTEPQVVISEPNQMGAMGYAADIVPFGDGFVQLQDGDGDGILGVLASDDGLSWSEVPSSPQLSGFPVGAASSGSRIVVLLVDPLDPSAIPTPWVSDDGGTTWTALPLPARPEPDNKYVIDAFYVGSVAVSGERIVMLAQEDVRVDWTAYVRDQTGEDHGQVGGEGFDPNSGVITVSFVDGFELTVDLDEAGLPRRSPPDSVTVLTHDGESWLDASETPLTGPDISVPQVVSGPAGFLYVVASQAMLSTDGVTWERHAAPGSNIAGAGMFGHALLGGPLGYVLARHDALYHSADGAAWNEVHRFEPTASPEMGGGPIPINPSAGGAGFLIPRMDHSTNPPTASYLWSADGVTWMERDLESGPQFFDSAVSDTTGLVVPIGAAGASMPTLPADDAQLAAAIASAFSFDDITDPEGRVVVRSWATQSEAECAGNAIVDSLGAERVREISFGAFPFTMLGYGLSLPIEMDDATPIAAALRHCIADWEMAMITTATGGTQYISEESARCVQAALDDDQAEQILAIELARPYDDQPSAGGPDLSHLGPMVVAFEGCLTEQELNAVDWN